MNNKNLEFVILYILIGCVILTVATISRQFSLQIGIDGFSANVIFIISTGIALGVYLSINLVIQNLMLPWISRWLVTIPYFRKRNRENTVTPREPIQLAKSDEPLIPNLEIIRKQQLQAEIQKKKEILGIALRYTQVTFAPYATEPELERLCQYISSYPTLVTKIKIIPVTISKELSSIDIYHFGWNLWNHFKSTNQEEIAHFLKIVFAQTLKDVEDEETIKKKLRLADGKCKIKILEDISK